MQGFHLMGALRYILFAYRYILAASCVVGPCLRKGLLDLHDLVADVMAGRADAVDAKRLAELVAELSSEDDMDEGERTQARNEATAVHKETRHPVTEEERAARQAAKAELRRKRKEAEERTAALQDSTAGGSGLSGRKYTVSIAIPGSIIDNAQSGELRTMVAGQLPGLSTK